MGTTAHEDGTAESSQDPAVQLVLLAIRGLSSEQRIALLSMLLAEGRA